MQVDRDAGEAAIGAFQHRLLDHVAGLSEYVAWHTGKLEQHPSIPSGGASESYKRCPANLFLDLESRVLATMYPRLFPAAPYLDELTKASAKEQEKLRRAWRTEILRCKSRACRLLEAQIREGVPPEGHRLGNEQWGQGTLFRRTPGGPLIARWYDHTGRRKERSTRTTDRAWATRILNKHILDSALRQSHIVDPAADDIAEQATRSIESHLVDYEAKMKAANRKPQTISATLGMIRTIASWASWKTVSDISADDLNRYAQHLKERGLAAQTIRNHLTTIKSFGKWLANNLKLPRDPLVSVIKPNAAAARKRERRMLQYEEWRWLESVTTRAPERGGVPGPERALLYEVAIETGLRANELRSVTRGQLFLDRDKPYIICKARSTKNQKPARQYVLPELAAALREHVSKKSPQTPVFAMPSRYILADVLRADLADARREWLKASGDNPAEYEKRSQSDFLCDVNHEGERLDFHSLRHTCGAWLAMSGAHPKAVQAVMRHSTITLTMDTYWHLFPGQEAETITRFAQYMGDESEAVRATGTADAAPRPMRQLMARDPAQFDAHARGNSGGCRGPYLFGGCKQARRGAT